MPHASQKYVKQKEKKFTEKNLTIYKLVPIDKGNLTIRDAMNFSSTHRRVMKTELIFTNNL